MTADVLAFFKEATAFAILAFIVIVVAVLVYRAFIKYAEVEKVKAEALKVKTGNETIIEEARATAAKAFASAEVAKLAKAEIEADADATYRNLQLTTSQQMSVLIAKLATGQELAVTAASGSEQRIIAAGASSEERVVAKFDDVRDDIVAGFKDWQEFSNMYMKMLLENPPATRPRLKRAMEAYSTGDMAKAQAIADEDVPGDAPPATVSASGQISEAPAGENGGLAA